MLYRVKQFFKGLFAWTSKEDNIIIDRFLNYKERILFNKLPAHERRHALDTAAAIIKGGGNEVLIKAGLLHDIGKTMGRIGIVKKSVLVLVDRFFPILSRKLSGRIHMLYIYYRHPEIGADMLQQIDTDSLVILLVKYHHSKGQCQIEGLDELRRADNSN